MGELLSTSSRPQAAGDRDLGTGDTSCLAVQTSPISILPVELLRQIFRATCIIRPAFMRRQVYLRAISSFRIATVCSQWRLIALDTPDLWTHITLSSGRRSSLDAACVQILLARSREASLSITLHVPANSPPDWWDDVAPALFDLLGQAAHRWRRVDMRLPINCLVPYIDVFCKDTPLLETLCLQNYDSEFDFDIWDDDVLNDSVDSFLPYCPRLSSIVMRSPGEAAVLPSRGPDTFTSPLESLVTLDLEGIVCDPDALWTVLSHAPNLRFLSLTQLDHDPEPPVPTTQLCLSKLKELRLYMNVGDIINNTLIVWAPFLELPALEVLDIGQAPAEVQAAIIPRVCKTVRSVSFGNEACVRDLLPHYATMAHVREATVEESEFILDREFFAVLRLGSMWPQLHSLRFIEVCLQWIDSEDSVGEPYPEVEECKATILAFLEFVRARNSTQSGARIDRIVFERCGIDLDLYQQLQELVADVRCVW